MSKYQNGPEGMARVERMSDSTINWVLRDTPLGNCLRNEQSYIELRNFAHAIAEEVLARIPATPPAQDSGKTALSAAIMALPSVPPNPNGMDVNDHYWWHQGHATARCAAAKLVASQPSAVPQAASELAEKAALWDFFNARLLSRSGIELRNKKDCQDAVDQWAQAHEVEQNYKTKIREAEAIALRGVTIHTAAVLPAVAVPEGWNIERLTDTKIRIFMEGDASVIVRESDHANNVPAYVLYGLASDLLDGKPAKGETA